MAPNKQNSRLLVGYCVEMNKILYIPLFSVPQDFIN